MITLALEPTCPGPALLMSMADIYIFIYIYIYINIYFIVVRYGFTNVLSTSVASD